MAILNSQLFWWYLVNTGTVLANGYFRYKPNYLKSFPLPPKISNQKAKILETLVDRTFWKGKFYLKEFCLKPKV